MKAFWRNVALWRRLVVPRLVITPPYITSDFNVQIYYSNWQSSQSFKTLKNMGGAHYNLNSDETLSIPLLSNSVGIEKL